MPLQKVEFRPGVNRETTNYAGEGGFFVVDKVRFRGGYAQKIGGWVNITNPTSSENTYNGIARSLWNYVTTDGLNLLGVGTNQKFYVESGGVYNDITPIASSFTLSDDPFSITAGSKEIEVASTAHGVTIGTFVNFSGATPLGSASFVIDGEYEVLSIPSADSFTIASTTAATSTVVGGGSLVVGQYDIDAGTAVYTTNVGWGGPPWGQGGWGSNVPAGIPLRLWSQFNYGNDLIFAENSGNIYYWTRDTSTWARATTLEEKANSVPKTTTIATAASGATTIVVADATGINTGAVVTGSGIPAGAFVTTAWTGSTSVTISVATTSSLTATAVSFSYAGRHVPNETELILDSPVDDFTVCMGSNPYDPTNFDTVYDPLIVRWSDADNPYEWVPEVTNQSGEQRLSNGSKIVAATTARQEIVVWTDTAVYSMQYLGPPFVWGFTLLDQDVSIASQNSVINVNNAVYWMGLDKFFVYDGRVNTLPCSIRQHIYSTLNRDQIAQVMCGNNEAFSEVWWFYPSTGSTVNDTVVIYNYLENVWSYGNLNRTAFSPQSIRDYPLLANSIQVSYLGANITATDTSITLLNASSYPRTGTIFIGSEQITYTGITNNTTLTGCVRGANGTVAASHTALTPVTMSYPNQVLFHEIGWDDVSTGTAQPIDCFIESSDFDIGDGNNFAFVSRIIPDVKFLGSTVTTPAVDISIFPRNYPGSAYGTPDIETVRATVVLPFEQYTEQLFTRVRGRQMAVRIGSTELGVAWQMGALRLDIRPDGRR
jgi:hypothetical protein